MRVPPSRSSHLPKTPSPNTITLRHKDFNTWILGEHLSIIYHLYIIYSRWSKESGTEWVTSNKSGSCHGEEWKSSRQKPSTPLRDKEVIKRSGLADQVYEPQSLYKLPLHLVWQPGPPYSTSSHILSYY